MDGELCEKSDLLPEWCAHCLGHIDVRGEVIES